MKNKRERAGIDVSTSPENKVRYNPGNFGDLRKHGRLVEIVQFLRRDKTSEPVRAQTVHGTGQE